MKVKAKICGIKTFEAAKAVQDGGAAFIGFVFYPPSPRNISPEDAGKLASGLTIPKVAVVVDPSDKLLESIMCELNPEYIQLHGKESDERAAEIKERYNVKIIRSRHPDSANKTSSLFEYILVDSPKGSLPGGNGVPFDWNAFTLPGDSWFLSGGLNVDNIEEAVRITGAELLDVSSGVESAPGVKDVSRITEFLKKLNDLA